MPRLVIGYEHRSIIDICGLSLAALVVVLGSLLSVPMTASASTAGVHVSALDVQSTVDGTGPFDSDDEAGDDSSESNGICRSFDRFDDWDGSGDPTQGWETASGDWMLSALEEAIGRTLDDDAGHVHTGTGAGQRTLWDQAVAEALANAHARRPGSRARVVGAGVMWYASEDVFGGAYAGRFGLASAHAPSALAGMTASVVVQSADDGRGLTGAGWGRVAPGTGMTWRERVYRDYTLGDNAGKTGVCVVVTAVSEGEPAAAGHLSLSKASLATGEAREEPEGPPPGAPE